MIKQNWVYVVFLFALLFFTYRLIEKKNAKSVKATAKVYKNKQEWGYDIFQNNSLYIHQDCIPAVPGNKGFKSQHDASIVAEAVVKKINKGELPFISMAELQQMNIPID